MCRTFIKSGFITAPDTPDPIPFPRGLLDTGAHGSSFVSLHLFNLLPPAITSLQRPTDRIVRLGDARHLAITLEVPLAISFTDSHQHVHCHTLWYSVVDSLSHDIIIGLIDLIGPYYDLFSDTVNTARQISHTQDLGNNFLSIMSSIDTGRQKTPLNPRTLIKQIECLVTNQSTYHTRKRHICRSNATDIRHVALTDGSVTDILTHPSHGSVFADNRVEAQYDLLAASLINPLPGTTLYPWSLPIDSLAPEETNTPDPTHFPDDILTYLTTSVEVAREVYRNDLNTHVSEAFRKACPHVIDLLTSDIAYDVFVPRSWNGIKMPPYHIHTNPDLPDSLRAKARPIRPTLYENALKEFGRMRTYFYAPSTSSYASPLVCAPKATDPHIRLCGDHREINKFITIPQEPIPNVPLSIAKCASFSLFIDLDMSHSFHQIPLDEVSSNLLSVATPWGLFRPLFLPEGVGPASGILQKIVRRIFADFDDWIIVIFDNFLVLANDFDYAYVKLEKILNVCKLHGIVLKMKKCWIGVEQVTFFGYQINPGSWSLSQQRKDSIHALLFPTNQKMMQSFLGCANFFHTHIPDYAKWSSELYDCTAATFNWDATT